MTLLIYMLFTFLVIIGMSVEQTYASVGTENAEIWYIRPSNECSINGDGLAYACASSNGSHGAWVAALPSNIKWTSITGVDDGDTLFICGKQTVPLIVDSSGGLVDKHITIRFDCPNNQGSITVSKEMPEAKIQVNWTQETSELWYLSLAQYTWKHPKRLWINNSELMPADVKANVGVSVNGGPIGRWWFDNTNSRLYYNESVNPAIVIDTMVSLVTGPILCEYATVCMRGTNNKYIDFINPVLEGGQFGAVYLTSASYITFKGLTEDKNSCRIGAKSPRGLLLSDSTTTGTGTPSHHIEVSYCTIDPQTPVSFDGYTKEFNGLAGDGVAMLFGTSDNYIHHNKIKNWQHTGINIAATLGILYAKNNIVEYNELVCDEHIEYCRAFGIDETSLGRTSGNIIQRNKITGMTIRSQLNGDNNIIQDNLFKDHRLGAARPDATQALDMEGYAGPSQDNIIRRNIFFNNLYGPCLSFRAGANIKSGYVIEQNTFINCGGVHVPNAENVSMYIQDTSSVGNQIIRNNRFLYQNGILPILYKGNGAVTIPIFQQNCSGDVCIDNYEFNITGLSNNDIDNEYSNGCGLGMWWDYIVPKEYFCLH